MKDCTFTVRVNGKKVVYDYDGFRHFLMDASNLAAVAPQFAGVPAAPKKKSTKPDKLMQAESPLSSNLTISQLYNTSAPVPRNPLLIDVPTTSKYKTAVEAREALKAIFPVYNKEALGLRQAMDKLRDDILFVGRNRTSAQQQALEAEFLATKEEFTRVVEKYRNIAIRMVAPGGVADMTWKPIRVQETVVQTGTSKTVVGNNVPGDLPPNVTEIIQTGLDYFRLIVGNHPELKGRTIPIRYFENQPAQRAFFNLDPSNVYIELAKPSLRMESITHELGHWLEFVSPETHRRVGEFLQRRAGRELPERLSVLTLNRAYKDHEVAVKDNFILPYIGKYYPPKGLGWKKGMLPAWRSMPASEVLSMGIQYMYENPARFAEQDPDMFDFIFDTLRISTSSTVDEDDILGLGHK